MSPEPDQVLPAGTSSPDSWNIVVEVDAGILRLPVTRIDHREVLIDTPVRLKIGDRFELIVERPDGLADLVHAEVVNRSKAGLLMRWKPSHPRELEALDRLFCDSTTLQSQPDIESALRSRSRLVRTSTIAAQRESVRVLNLSAVRDLIQDAVEDALRESGRLLDESELKDLIEESEKGFQQRLAEFEHEKADLQSRIQGLSNRFERAQELLDKERNREVDRDRFALSKDALGELEGTFGRIIDDAVASSEVGASFEMELRVVMERCLDSERERVRDLEEKARSENIDLLERKIQRLASSLDEARSDRDQALETVRRAESRDSRGPSAGAIDAVQPSASDDPQAQRRRALLIDLMQENRDLRQKLNADNKKLKVTEKGQA
ncbi:MAG: hypothetical protein HRU16_09170 [Planctomycetes bacterium]|nr:hypothetical protein [Planctomycetota bacterium]